MPLGAPGGGGGLSQGNGKGRKDEPILECCTLVAGEPLVETGDKYLSHSGRPHVRASQSNTAHLGQKEGFLWRSCPAQSVFSGFFQDLWVSRKILTRDRRMGTAIGRKSGM